jgi:predicted NUDIX family NTP pyrophosphohydrolase
MYRLRATALEVLLVHPGGPFFRNKDAGAWTIPKGEPGPVEELFDLAVREFQEETGFEPAGPYLKLEPVRQKSGKRVHAWAFEGDCEPAALRSNTFQLEWPPRSGKFAEFPEVDRAEFFALEQARHKINPAQVAILDELAAKLAERSS